jgi:hypothetical protein
MIDPDDGIQSLPWTDLEPPNTPQCFYMPAVKALLATGEHVKLKEAFWFPNGGSGMFGQIIRIADNKVLLQLYADSAFANGTSLPHLPHSLRSPKKRTYVGYPEEVVRTNFVRWYLPSKIEDGAFIFLPRQIEGGYPGLSVGMSNARCIRYKWNSTDDNVSLLTEEFHSFPLRPNNCFSKVGWQFLSKITRHLQCSLGKTRIGDSPSSSFKIDITECEWAYLQYRLLPLKKFVRPGASSIHMIRERGTQETVREKVEKAVYKIDSLEALEVFRLVFGQYSTAGVRKKFPSAPRNERGALKFGYASQTLDNVDKINIVSGLQDTSPAIYKYDRKERGIIIRYDSKLEKLQVTIKFKKKKADQDSVRRELKLERSEHDLTDSDHFLDSDGDSAVLSVDVSVNDLLSGEEACFTVRRVENRRVFCFVSETDDSETYPLGQEVEFTLTKARSMI